MRRGARNRGWLGVAVGAVLLTTLACGGGTSGDAGAPARSAFGFEPRPVPSLALPDLNGGIVDPAAMTGKVRMVDFWATWCAPCIEAIPHFKELHERYGDRGFVLIGVAMDEEGAAVVAPLVEKYEIPYTIVLGTEETAEAFGGLPGYPTAFFVNREGTIVERLTGAVPKRILEGKIRDLLGDEGGGGEEPETVASNRKAPVPEVR